MRKGLSVLPREEAMSMRTGQGVHPHEETMTGRSSSSPRRSLSSFTASREERLQTVHEVPVTCAFMSKNEDRLSQWRLSTNRQLRRERRLRSLRSGTHVPSHLAKLHSSQFQQGPPSSALDRMHSFGSGRGGHGDDEREGLGMIYSVKKHSKPQGEEEGSSTACDGALDAASRSIEARRTRGDPHKRRRGAWELACALAYAYLHQQKALGIREGEDECRVGSSKNRISARADAVCHMAEVVNPTQAAQWFGDRAALVS